MGGNPNPNQENLKPFDKLDAEEAQRIRKLGAKASNKVQKENKKNRKTFKDIYEIIFNSEIKDENARIIIKEKYPDLDLNNKALIAIETFNRMFKKGKEFKDGKFSKKMSDKDFQKYIEFTRDTMGEAPKLAEPTPPTINITVNTEKQKDLMDKI